MDFVYGRSCLVDKILLVIQNGRENFHEMNNQKNITRKI